jgi:hypothetical protein
MPEFTYKGTPPRPWIRLELITPDGETRAFEAVADTGNPLPLIVSSALMFDCCHLGGPGTETNFGRLDGGFLRVRIPETGVDAMIFGYASDQVTDAIQDSSPDFEGLVGLPLLRRLEFGGNADHFWVR